jgi:hypothetical protein
VALTAAYPALAHLLEPAAATTSRPPTEVQAAEPLPTALEEEETAAGS